MSTNQSHFHHVATPFALYSRPPSNFRPPPPPLIPPRIAAKIHVFSTSICPLPQLHDLKLSPLSSLWVRYPSPSQRRRGTAPPPSPPHNFLLPSHPLVRLTSRLSAPLNLPRAFGRAPPLHKKSPPTETNAWILSFHSRLLHHSPQINALSQRVASSPPQSFTAQPPPSNVTHLIPSSPPLEH
jgi:hypothetical protein